MNYSPVIDVISMKCRRNLVESAVEVMPNTCSTREGLTGVNVAGGGPRIQPSSRSGHLFVSCDRIAYPIGYPTGHPMPYPNRGRIPRPVPSRPLYKSPIHPISPLRARGDDPHLPARPAPAMDDRFAEMVGGVR